MVDPFPPSALPRAARLGSRVAFGTTRVLSVQPADEEEDLIDADEDDEPELMDDDSDDEEEDDDAGDD